MKTTPAVHVEADPALLDALLADMDRPKGVWRPKARWAQYARRMAPALRALDPDRLRMDRAVVKGFADFDAMAPMKPRAPWKRAVWDGLHRAPGFSTITSEYRRLLQGEFALRVDAQVRAARLLLDRLADEFPHLAVPTGTAAGGAADAFEWRGITVSAAWVEYLARAADLYRRPEGRDIASILEIGPGLGFSTLAHRALNPHLDLVVNIDIPTVLYVSTLFLRATADAEIVDYRATRGERPIRLEPGEPGRLRIYQLAPWQIEDIEGEVDIALNAASFQEMDKETCAAYADQVKRLASRMVMLHASDPDRPHDAARAHTEVGAAWLCGLYADRFGMREVLTGGWKEHYARRSEYRAILLQRT